MKQRRKIDIPATPDLYFIESATDGRGRRVLVQEGAIDNWIWPEDGLDDFDKLIGITAAQRGQIEAFFSGEVLCKTIQA